MRKGFGLDRREKVVVLTTSSLLPILLRRHERRLQGLGALQYMSVSAVERHVFNDDAPPNNSN